MTTNLHKDPVCGMNVDPSRAAGELQHQGTTYYFCSKSCVARFTADPEKCLQSGPVGMQNANSGSVQIGAASSGLVQIASPSSKKSSEKSSKKDVVPNVAGGVTWICPMDPEVRESQPGPCPICGMALEPETISADTPEDDSELRSMSTRLWVSGALSIPLLLAAMLEMGAPSIARMFSGRWFAWVQLAMATPVVLWGGAPFFQRGWNSLRTLRLNMFTLIALGTAAAYLYSLVAVVAPGIFPASAVMRTGYPGLYFEAAAIIVTLVLLGQVLELRARRQTSGAIRSLLELAPKSARKVNADGSESDVPLESIQAGDMLRIRPGEKVPTDALVIEGSSVLDESMLTGESMPVEKAAGMKVIGGTVNGTGSLLVRAERVGSGTLLAQIVKLVSEAQRSRAPIQALADKVAGYFVPAVIAVAAITFFAWLALGPEPRLAHALVNAVAVLIIACPCALGLATPMAIMVGTGRGAQAGVLVKNAEALESLATVRAVVVDKTGTLTEGRPRVASILPMEGVSEVDLLTLAAALERGSEHPLAGAIVKAAEERSVIIPAATDVGSSTGMGIAGNVQARRIIVGNAAMMRQSGIAATQLAVPKGQSAQTLIYVAAEGKLLGVIGVADPIKESAADALRDLRNENVQVVMLTGDSQATAEAVAKELGITEFHAEMLPEQKLDAIKRLQKIHGRIAMAGDGVNDAPALAQADIGIAMGTGTDVAMQSAAVTLLKGDLRGIVRARRLSHATMRNIRQNLFFAFIYNLVGVPIAAGILYPVFGILLSPMVAAAAMSLSSVSVIGNALRLRRVRL